MANTRPMRVAVALAAVLAAVPAWAANPCEEGREQTGLALAAREGGLEIAAVDPDSAAAESGIRTGDALVQVNAMLPRSCADYARAVRDARDGRKALRLHRQLEALAARHTAPPAAVDGLRTVLRYFDAAEVAWAADESVREHERRPRHLPSSEGQAAPFFADSDAAATIEEFPFLRATVSRDPRPGLVGESSGLWRPVQARGLLWSRGGGELERLTEWLGVAGR